MLVLSRRANQSILLKKDGQVICRFMLVDIRGDKARVGFEAAPDINIVREEIDGRDSISTNRGEAA